MRILALVTDAFGGYGGIAQYNRDLLTALSASPRVERVLVLPRIAGQEIGDLPDKVEQVPPCFAPSRYSLRAFSRAGGRIPFDVVFCGHIKHLPLAEALRQIFGAPVWLQLHGVEAWECPSRWMRALVERADLVTTVSRYTRQRVLSWAGLDPETFRVIPNTVRPMFAPGPRSESTLVKFGLSEAQIILTVGRINKADQHKGHRRVIEAMAAVRQLEPKAVYVIVGSGDDRDDLEHFVDKRGLSECVRFLGRLGDDEALALYRSANVFVMPSTKEGFGIVFVEAAATCLPVIAGNRDGSVDALADGKLGRLIDPLSQEELVAALFGSLRDPRPVSCDVRRFAFDHFAQHVTDVVESFVA